MLPISVTTNKILGLCGQMYLFMDSRMVLVVMIICWEIGFQSDSGIMENFAFFVLDHYEC